MRHILFKYQIFIYNYFVRKLVKGKSKVQIKPRNGWKAGKTNNNKYLIKLK